MHLSFGDGIVLACNKNNEFLFMNPKFPIDVPM